MVLYGLDLLRNGGIAAGLFLRLCILVVGYHLQEVIQPPLL
jgi:hypothetical protein